MRREVFRHTSARLGAAGTPAPRSRRARRGRPAADEIGCRCCPMRTATFEDLLDEIGGAGRGQLDSKRIRDSARRTRDRRREVAGAPNVIAAVSSSVPRGVIARVRRLRRPPPGRRAAARSARGRPARFRSATVAGGAVSSRVARCALEQGDLARDCRTDTPRRSAARDEAPASTTRVNALTPGSGPWWRYYCILRNSLSRGYLFIPIRQASYSLRRACGAFTRGQDHDRFIPHRLAADCCAPPRQSCSSPTPMLTYYVFTLPGTTPGSSNRWACSGALSYATFAAELVGGVMSLLGCIRAPCLRAGGRAARRTWRTSATAGRSARRRCVWNTRRSDARRRGRRPDSDGRYSVGGRASAGRAAPAGNCSAPLIAAPDYRARRLPCRSRKVIPE